METSDQNKATIARFNKEFIEGGSLDAFQEILAPDFVNRTAPPGVPTGPEGVAYFFNHLLKTAFPDLTVEIHDQVAEADKVTTRKTFHATHQDDFFGVPATNRPVAMDVIDVIRLREGQFVEHWGLVDWQQVMAQLTA